MLLRNKRSKVRSLTVNFDAYGNAVPDTPSIQTETSSIAATIVETREILIHPSKKQGSKSQPGYQHLLKTLLPRRAKPAINLPAKTEFIPRQAHHTHASPVSEVLEQGFRKLHDEFQRREQQLELRFQALSHQQQHKPLFKKYWLIPLAIAGTVAMGYMLYVLTSMQQSMTIMSSSIPTMNQHMGEMAQDTHYMSQNMQALNGNITHMNHSFQQMNQQMGTVSRAMIPMGQAAETTQPFLSMMRSFMPF